MYVSVFIVNIKRILLQERIRAREIGYEDPINPTYESTSEMYHKTLNEILRQIDNDIRAGKDKKIGIMVATHNEDTIRFAVEKYVFLELKILVYMPF
ncbi:Proline dehydrogenase 1, mitochondrial, partial [Stegodyphus mimosarum]